MSIRNLKTLHFRVYIQNQLLSSVFLLLDYENLQHNSLTFEEFSGWIAAERLVLSDVDEPAEDTGKTRLFPVPGGILRSMFDPPAGYSYLSVDGVDNCIAAIEEFHMKFKKLSFIEACKELGAWEKC